MTETAWRELEQLADSPEMQEFLEREFPSQAARFGPAGNRRDFMRLMGASLALAGATGCTRQPRETIHAFARSPEHTIPGRPRLFATARPRDGLGLLVESHEGRPTKIEGNPDHPASLGATDALAQAEILSLYDPDRSRVVLEAGRISTFDAFLERMGGELEALSATAGAGLHVLLGAVRSPTLAAQLAELTAKFPALRIHHWDPLHRDLAREGARLAFGRDLVARTEFERADRVLSIDADFLTEGDDCLRSARQFAARRRAQDGEASEMNRLYALESTPTLTGAFADHRLALRPSRLDRVARAIARQLGVELEVKGPLTERENRFVQAISSDLDAHRGRSLVIAGPHTPPAVQALVHVLNQRLGNVGQTVQYAPPAGIETDPGDHRASIASLVEAMQSGSVRALVMLGGNPVYDAPRALAFASALDRVPLRVHLAQHVDETSRLCHWHVPQAHFLESWGDTRAFDGSVSIVQPLIAPLYGGKTELELLSVLLGRPGATAHDIVRQHWQGQSGDDDFESRWRHWLHDGRMANSAVEPAAVPLAPSIAFGSPTPERPGIELSFRPDPCVLDGRFANNGWLQEQPRPITRLVWSNAALIAPATARRLNVEKGDVLTLQSGDRVLEAPAWILPGHAEESITLHLGYGRKHGGRIAAGVGVDAYALREAGEPWTALGVAVSAAGHSVRLVTVQDHNDMEGRDFVRVVTHGGEAADEHAQDHASGHAPGGHDVSELSMHPPRPREGPQWGMVIDLNACTGCNACMVSCQSENNVPVVGVDEVANGREMHWIRIDTYYEGEEEDPAVLHQPLPCMHCEQAPCEVVCPVAATVHSPSGLNEMVYNRCVGTRYCANNCPYKVRRFNFYKYSDYETEVLKLGRNPDVTTRSRGVMEKCSYCVQRINQAGIQAKLDDRSLTDGEVVTACQQACPTQAIVFGDIDDEGSAVAQARQDPTHYALLEELGTAPRTTYLARHRNLNPELRDS